MQTPSRWEKKWHWSQPSLKKFWNHGLDLDLKIGPLPIPKLWGRRWRDAPFSRTNGKSKDSHPSVLSGRPVQLVNKTTRYPSILVLALPLSVECTKHKQYMGPGRLFPILFFNGTNGPPHTHTHKFSWIHCDRNLFQILYRWESVNVLNLDAPQRTIWEDSFPLSSAVDSIVGLYGRKISSWYTGRSITSQYPEEAITLS